MAGGRGRGLLCLQAVAAVAFQTATTAAIHFPSLSCLALQPCKPQHPTPIAPHLDKKADASPHYWADNKDWRGPPTPLRNIWEGEAARYQQAQVCQHQHQTDLHCK